MPTLAKTKKLRKVDKFRDPEFHNWLVENRVRLAGLTPEGLVDAFYSTRGRYDGRIISVGYAAMEWRRVQPAFELVSAP
jgi:hypothetical protein